MGFSFMHLVVVLVIVLLLFGAGRVPEVMENLAKGVKSFKKGLKDDDIPAVTDKTKKDDGMKG